MRVGEWGCKQRLRIRAEKLVQQGMVHNNALGKRRSGWRVVCEQGHVEVAGLRNVKGDGRRMQSCR
eukprot:6204588-Pleurochrysis_carterae.AAC.2